MSFKFRFSAQSATAQRILFSGLLAIAVLWTISAPAAFGMGPAVASVPATNACRPGEGWIWASGSLQPETAAQAQQALNQAGIAATVEARGFGEADDCGTFTLMGVDFILTVGDSAVLSDATTQTQLAAVAYPILTPLARPAIGNVKIRSTSGDHSLVSLAPPDTASHDIHVTAAAQLAFVGLSGNNTLAVINTADNSIIQSGISVGGTPGRAVFAPSGRRLYEINGSGNSVSVVDIPSYQVVKTIPVGTNPRGIAISKDGSKVYVANNATQNLSIIDTGTLSVVKTLALSSHPEEIAISPDGRRLYIAATVPFMGFILDTVSETLIGSFASSAGNGIAITPDGTRAYITNWNGTVTVVNLATMLADKTIPVGSFPHRVTISPNGLRAYVANVNSNNVSVIDTRSNTVVTTIPVGSSPWAMDILDDSSRLYVPTGAGYVAVIDTGTNTVLQQISMGAAANSVSIFHAPASAVHKKVYVIVYDPLLSNGKKLSTHMGWNSYLTLNQGTIDLFKQASHNQLWYDIVDTTVVTSGWPVLNDGYQYTEASYLATVNHTISPPSNAMVNYNAIVNSAQFDICGKANRGEIDEVWIFNGPWFGFYESTLVGPGAYWYNSGPVPGPYSCNRLIPIMGPNPERGVAEEVHNFGHRYESTMQKVYGQWQQNRTANSWEKFALVKSLSPSYAYSGCGNTHFPPNGTSDYDYTNTSSISSNCSDFSNYPNLHTPTSVLQPVNCSLWGCTHLDYLGYWFSHVPSSSGCGSDNVANDWWKYISNPNLAITPSAACQTASPSLQINFTTGKPGSFFTLSGTNFSPNGPATLTLNGNNLGTTNADSAGNLIFVLNTSSASTGWYFATVTNVASTNISSEMVIAGTAGASFRLDDGAPVRPQIDAGTLLSIPAGISVSNQNIFLPHLSR